MRNVDLSAILHTDRRRDLPVPTTPRLTVDAVILDPGLGILLIRRGRPPFAGCWALPGGFVDLGETCEAACVREVREETGLEVSIVQLVGVYSDPSRDPRGHTVSAVYLCRPVGGEASAGDDASDARWWRDLTGVDLAFDHRQVLDDVWIEDAGVGRSAKKQPPSDGV